MRLWCTVICSQGAPLAHSFDTAARARMRRLPARRAPVVHSALCSQGAPLAHSFDTAARARMRRLPAHRAPVVHGAGAMLLGGFPGAFP